MSVNHIYTQDELSSQVALQKSWTAWSTQARTNRSEKITVTKVPYARVGVPSQSDDRNTWISIDDAQRVATTKGFIGDNGIGGSGIFLGIAPFCEEYRLGGIDLDTCL